MVTALEQPSDELNATTFDIYLYLVKVHAPTGPREIMRAMDIASPGVVHRHLQKLTDWGWADKDSYGRYFVKKKVGFQGYFWAGSRLVSTSFIFAFSFVVLAAAFIALLVFHLWYGSPIDEAYALLIIVTVIAMALLLFEALRPRKRLPKQQLAGA